MMMDWLLLLLQNTLLSPHWYFYRLVTLTTDTARRAHTADRSARAGAEVREQLERGDLLEVPRTLFTHFGIYLGEGKVAHLIPDILPLLTRDKVRVRAVVSNNRLLMGVVFRTAAVRVDTLDDFMYGARVLEVNGMDAVLGELGVQPVHNQQVALTAESLLGTVPYSLLWNNCEHFVTFCRYGTGISLQTDKFCEFLKSVLRDERSVLLTAVCGVLSVLVLGLSFSTALPAFLIPFTLWMAG